MENLIIKYLNKEITDEEILQLNQWRMENSENETLFREMESLWALTSLDDDLHIDTDKAWHNFQEETKSKAKIFPFWKNAWLRVAVVILLVLGTIFISKIILDPLQHVDSGNSTLTITLPDNSKITLNKNSHIDYPKKFVNNRKITLNGEAFFWVTKDTKHPFTIETTNGQVQVVGTSFNIDCNKQQTIVSVKTGKVSLSNSKNKTFLLPGQQGLITNSTDTIATTSSKEQAYDYYLTHKIKCNNTPLKELTPILEKTFQIKVIFQNNSLLAKTITAEFPDNNLSLISDILAKTLDLKITLKGKTLYINQ